MSFECCFKRHSVKKDIKDEFKINERRITKIVLASFNNGSYLESVRSISVF